MWICQYFINVGAELASNIPISNNIYPNRLQQNSVILSPTDEVEIKNIIGNLNKSKASGYDNITVNMVKLSKNEISVLLTILINKSFESGIVPSQSKIAKVTPIFKNGDKEIISNYRPISVLPILSKIIEKVVNLRIQNFLINHHLLYANQYGFRKASDTETAVLDTISEIKMQIDKNYKCGIISLNLCKAFDTVNHKILLGKIHDLGVRGIVHTWFANYLSNKFQYGL